MPIEAEKFNGFNLEKDKLEKFKNFIMTGQEYQRTSFSRDPKVRSYVFKLKNDKKEIVYFGSSHINDPEDPLFENIKEEFEKAKPDMVYIEGWASINNKKDSIRNKMRKVSYLDMKLKSESHYVLKLAVEAGADFESPEPDFYQELLYQLDNGFSKKDIFSYYIYRVIDQYGRQHKDRSIKDCKKYLEPYFSEFYQESKWSTEEINLFKKEILDELDVEDLEKHHVQVDPTSWEENEQTIINEVASNSTRFRDRYIFERIFEGLKKYNKIFVVYGSSHAVMQEPAFKELFSGAI